MKLRPPEGINLAGQDTGRDQLSESSIATQLRCSQLWGLHYIDRLSPVVKAESLSMGSAFAAALAAGDPSVGYQQIVVEAAELKARASGNPWITAPNDHAVLVQAAIVENASRCYVSAYGTHPRREVDLRVRIRNPETGRYSRTHDLVCRVDGLDDRAIYEDKLVGQLNRRQLPAVARYLRQLTIEAYAVWRATGVHVKAIHYRPTLKPAIRLRKDETFDDYIARIGTEYAERPDHYLAEEVTSRTLDDFLQLEAELWQWAAAARDLRRAAVRPRNTGACSDYSGCQFLPICSGEPGAEEQFAVREQRPKESPCP